MIGGRTALYGVVGWPVGHSLSPAMQNAAFAFHRLDAAYVALPVEPAALETALRGAHALGFQGLNVTIPHKQAAAAICETLDPVAAACGAANTLRRDPGRLGRVQHRRHRALAAPRRRRGAGRRGRRCSSAPAARRGPAAGRRSRWGRGCTSRPGGASRPRRSARRWPMRQGRGATAPRCWRGSRWARPSRAADVVMNGTSVGLAGQRRAASLASVFRRGQVALDMVYGDTAFTREARDGRRRVVRGEELLVRQGALAFTLWTGRAAPEAVMIAALTPERRRATDDAPLSHRR